MLQISGDTAAGAIVALRADDERYPYYVMKVVKAPYICKKDESDSWGSKYPAGTNVIKGHYFDSTDGNFLDLHLLKRLFAVIPTHSVVYICSEVDVNEDGKLNLNDSLHRRILKALE